MVYCSAMADDLQLFQKCETVKELCKTTKGGALCQ
jgi:hypothetical protein